jgi:hypothetical protein
VLEAEAELQGLGAEIRRIEAQLGDPNRTDRETGQRLDVAAWEAWRTRAKGALGHKTARYRWLKAWIRTRRREDALPAREHDSSREAELLCLASGALRLLEEVAGGVAAGRPPEAVLTPSRRRAIGGLRAWLEAALAAQAGGVGDDAPAGA